jgi:hypothetical protein
VLSATTREGGCHGSRPRAFASTTLASPHPSQQSAYLPCTRPPDFVTSRHSFTIFAPEQVFPTVGCDSLREFVLFIGTRFSNLYTTVDTPAEAA